MGPSPGVSGGEEALSVKPGHHPAFSVAMESTKRQRRPSVRLGEPSDHPASNILQNAPKRRRLEEEEEEEEEGGVGEEEEEQVHPEEVEQVEEVMVDKKVEGGEQVEKDEEGDAFHNVPVQGDFPLSSKTIHPLKARARTLEHVASSASQSQWQREATAPGSLPKQAVSEPVLSSKESEGEEAAVEQDGNGEHSFEQGLGDGQGQAEKPSTSGRKPVSNNGLSKRGRYKRGGRRGGSNGPYRSIGGILQGKKVSREGKAGGGKEVKVVAQTDSVKKSTAAANATPARRLKEETASQTPLPLPPLPLPTLALPPPPISDKELESSERGPVSSEATQSSFNEQANGDQQEKEQEKSKKVSKASRSRASKGTKLALLSPLPETNGDNKEEAMKEGDAAPEEGMRDGEEQVPTVLTVGDLSLRFVRKAVGAFSGGVRPWLGALGLGHHAEIFDSNEVDPVVLPLLTMEDLTEMRIPTGPKRKMFTAIQVLRDSVL